MKLLLAFSLLIVTIDAVPRKVVLAEWKKFKDTYDKTYADEKEELSRLKTYWNNRRIIQHHNKKFNKGKVSFDVSVNHFSDFTANELAALRGYKTYGTINRNGTIHTILDELPANVDWREKGAVTPIKNQRKCGSCYAFASVAALESHYYLATGITTDLSEQNVIDCAWPHGPCGCDGGWMHPVFDYIRNNGGIDSEESYPYQMKDCFYCRYKPKYNTATCSGYIDLPEGDEHAVKSTVALIGPVVVAIDADAFSFDHYKSGIYYEPCCRSNWSSHAVVVIGYGTSSDGKDYWIIKNSWGTKWGEDGFMRMTRNLNNHCGISSWAGYPII